jgi:branched-chain amino acid aminotransferase
MTVGDGVFETLAVSDGVPLWRFEHLDRMRKAASELGIPFPEDAIENAVDALTHKAKGSHVLRLILTRGDAARGLAGDGTKHTVLGSLKAFDASQRFQPVTVVTSAIRRNPSSPSSRLKTISYIDNILAAREAQAKEADEALMLNTAGRVACVTIGNVFLEKDDMLFTPSLSEGILPGVMRAAVIAVARSSGIVVREKQVKPRDVETADFMFVTNSLRFVRPVTRMDGKRLSLRSKSLDKIMHGLLKMEQQQLLLD